jgi:DNA-binding transcriptional regulator YbjK
MAGVTAAVTPKGERRRSALICAAAELLCHAGFEAVTHRAVAERAGLPLASTTYYFSSLEELISRYERYIACARHPSMRGVERRLLKQRVDAVGEAMARSGRCARPDMMTALLYSVDGAVVSALVDDQDGPRVSVRATLVDVIDVLAPIDPRI